MIFLTGGSSPVKESPANDYDDDVDQDDDQDGDGVDLSEVGDDGDLEWDGGLVWGEKGVPVELPLKLLPVFTVHKLEHRLVHNVRLGIIR